MTVDNKVCPKCSGVMQVGWMVDRGHLQAISNPKWTQGEFQWSFWTGGKLNGPEIPVQTYRCDSCYYLESYAPEVEE